MRFLNKERWYLLSLWLVASCAATDVRQFPHGTAVITLFNAEGVVMASDGLQVAESRTGDPTKSFLKIRGEAEPKITVCASFFCFGGCRSTGICLQLKGVHKGAGISCDRAAF
jgi:hypothetical protein